MTKDEMMTMEALKKENRRLTASKVIGWVVAGVSAVAAIYCGKKMHDISKMMNLAITDVENMTFIDISQAIVDKAVDKAAQNAAVRAVRATEGIMHDTVEKAVRSAVEASKGHLKQAVTEKIAKEVADIDKSELVDDITEKAKELIVEKFDGKLDDIAKDFSHNLESMGKIYQSIAEQMQKKGGE